MFGVLCWLVGLGTYRLIKAMFPSHPKPEPTEEDLHFEQWTKEVRSRRVRRTVKLVSRNPISEEE